MLYAMGMLKKIRMAARNRTTYRVGLLQSKAYRSLQQHTAGKLAPSGISPSDWAFLGLLYDNAENPIRPREIADELGVEAPFVTRLFEQLRKKGLVQKKPDPRDRRATLLFLTAQGREFVQRTEALLREETKGLLKDIPRGDILSYIAVLEKIIENSNE